MAVARSWMSAVALAAVTVLGASLLAAGSAHAQPLGQLQCEGTESDTYSPGVIFQPRNIHITTNGRFGSCIDSAGQVKSGSYAEQSTVFAGCNDLFDGFKGQRIFFWNTGDTSVVKATGSSTAVAGQVVTTITGTVIQGRYRGRTAVEVIPLPQPGVLQCRSDGFTDATGVTTLTIT